MPQKKGIKTQQDEGLNELYPSGKSKYRVTLTLSEEVVNVINLTMLDKGYSNYQQVLYDVIGEWYSTKKKSYKKDYPDLK